MTDLDPQVEAKMRARVEAATNRAEEATEAAELATAQRDEIIVEAVESHFDYRTVARWARLSPSRVYGIVGEH